MADGNQLKIDDQVALADDDPFAELTRIMGFDPRQPAKAAAPGKLGSAPQSPVQQAPAPIAPATERTVSAQPVAAPVEDAADEDDFSIDLEKELMGQFAAEDEDVAAEADAPAAAPAAAVAPEPDEHDIDFDLAEGFDAAMAASVGDAEPDLDLPAGEADAGEQPQAAAPVDFAPEVADAVEDDTDIAAEFDAAMADIDMDFAPDAQAAETAVADAGGDKESVPAVQDDTGETELRLLEEDELHLGADDFHLEAADLHLDDDELRIAEAEPHLEEDSPVEEDGLHVEEGELSFDDVDFAGELDAAAEEPVADLESPEETVPVPSAREADVLPRYQPAEPARYEPVEPEMSPMDAAAAEYRGRDVDPVAVSSEFNLEDELNALLGNRAPAKAAPFDAFPSNEGRDVSAAPLDAFSPNERRNDLTSANAAEIEQPFDDMDWDLDDKSEAAAPEPVEDDLPEEVYAEDDLPQVYAQDDLPEEIYAEDSDSQAETSATMDDGYDSVADAAPQAAAAVAMPVFDVAAFVAETTRRFDAVRAPEPYTYRPADTAARYATPGAVAREPERFSPHRDPVVRGDPLKEDPLDVITALAEKYSKPLPQASYGRANTVAPPAPPAPMPPRQLAEVQDEAGDNIDFSAAFDDAPEVETVEVADRAVALADDLDIPELAYDEELPPVSAYDDLDTEFASLLTDMNAEPAPSRPVAQAANAYDDDFSAPARAYPADRTAAAPTGVRHASTIPGAYDDEPDQYGFDADDLPGSRSPKAAQYAEDEFDYDPDLDDAISVPDIAAASRRKPQRRGMLVAAIVGGVAIVGGLGAFALSFGDGTGSDTPAIVKADDGPVKVKPENPGGTTVPNQESKVYDTVSGEGAAEPPQEKLVTTAEEPVDMTPPADVEPAEEDMAAGTMPKGEDRIEQILQEAENQTDAEVAAVAPRKVRTMVVKPDGTLVPREAPEAAKVAVPADQPETLASAQDTLSAPESTGALPVVPDNEQILTPPAGEAPAAAETPAASPEMQTAAPAPEMQTAPPPELQESANTPDSVPIAPLRPVDQPIDVVGEVKADQVASAATSANGSAWSMQIASQPSEAAAQSSYQDLARRYGSVLEGREVNIVKAEIAGKGTFWRVRVPAKSRNEAISLCENYKASGGNCFVSR